MGLSGDTLAVFCLFVGLAGGGAMTAVTQTGRVRFWLGVATAALAGAAVAVWVTAARLPWDSVLPFAYAAVPPLTVGMVMLRGRRREGGTGGATREQVEEIVTRKLAALPKPEPLPALEPAETPQPFPKEALLSALDTLAAPLIAKAKLDRLRAIQMPTVERPEHYVTNSPDPPERLYDLRRELSTVECSLEEDADPRLRERLKAEEARIMGDAKYITQTPDDPVVWPTLETKRL